MSVYCNSIASKKNTKILSASKFSHLLPESLIPVINLYFRIYEQIFEKIKNGSNRVYKAMEETEL